MKRQWEDKVVWITGGGSGIGRAIALEYARQGAHVALSGRRLERLEEVARELEALGARALSVQCDVSVERDVVDAVSVVAEHFGRIDVAIANAGFGVGGDFETLTADDWRRQFDVNVVGAATTARQALSHLKKSAGRVVFVGSVAGVVSAPGNSAYHASKYAVRAIGQCLSMELVGTGVSCTVIQPGFVESEIGRVDNSGQFQEEWTDKRPQAIMWSAEKSARVILDAIWRREREFTFTGHGKVAVFLGQHAPGLVHHIIAGAKRLGSITKS